MAMLLLDFRGLLNSADLLTFIPLNRAEFNSINFIVTGSEEHRDSCLVLYERNDMAHYSMH